MSWTAIFSTLAALTAAALIPAAAAAAGGYHVEFAFQGPPADGESPRAALMDFGGQFYGSTGGGGAKGQGVLYRFDPTSGAETVAYSFGTKFGNGRPSDGRLVRVGDKLYGVSPGGGAGGFGAVYQFYPQSGAVAIIYSFKGGTGDGAAYPYGGLTNVGGQLYGTTQQGGSGRCSAGCGTVFQVDPRTGTETVIYAFPGAVNDTSYPGSTLIAVGGILYGTSASPGTQTQLCDNQGCGVLFAVDPATKTESVVHAFTGLANGDGWYPGPDLINVGGVLYGVTERGGISCAEVDYGCGTVFSFDPATGVETVLYAFAGGADGVDPKGGLAEVRGALYGTTEAGGRQMGTIFSLDPASGVETVLHAFRGRADGATSEAGLFYAGHQVYGTTQNGGGSANCTSGCGTVFAFKP